MKWLIYCTLTVEAPTSKDALIEAMRWSGAKGIDVLDASEDGVFAPVRLPQPDDDDAQVHA